MSQAALALVGADLEHADVDGLPEAGQVNAVSPEAEAARLAEIAAAFALFGLPIDQPGDPDFPLATADLAYRAYEVSPEAPANDWVENVTPSIERRGLHVDPTLPVKLVQAIDWFIVLAATQFAAMWGTGAGLLQLSIGQAAAFLVSALALKVGLWLTDYYRFSPARLRPERGMGGLALGAIAGLLISNVFAPDARGAAALAATIPFAAMLLAGVHAALAVWISAAHRRGLFAETIVLVGATEAAQRLARRAARSGEVRIAAVVDDRASRTPSRIGDAPVIGGVDDLLAWDGLPHVDRIVITVSQKAEARVRTMIGRLRRAPNRVDLLLDFDTHAVRGRQVERFGGAAVACVSGRPHNHRRALVKRAQDLIIGSMLLAMFALPMLLIAALIKLDTPGPALYRQRRHGLNNRIFTVLKFRTMRHEPGAALEQVCTNDPRITAVGAFLRRTSLDELPQLVNVLRGEMSLVGPRPHAVGMKTCERELTEIAAEYAHRHRVRPGITGWAQINGSRGPVNSTAAVRRRVRLDLEYIARSSLWFDLEILIRSAPSLLGDKSVR